MGVEALTFNDISNTKRKQLGDDVPVPLFRLIRLIGMHKILGESAGHTLYLVGKDIGKELEVDSADDFLRLVQDLKIGIPHVTESSEDKMVVFVEECITCSGLPNIGEMVCHLEGGLITGAVERILKRPAKGVQTKSSSMGFKGCEFEIHLF